MSVDGAGPPTSTAYGLELVSVRAGDGPAETRRRMFREVRGRLLAGEAAGTIQDDIIFACGHNPSYLLRARSLKCVPTSPGVEHIRCQPSASTRTVQGERLERSRLYRHGDCSRTAAPVPTISHQAGVFPPPADGQVGPEHPSCRRSRSAGFVRGVLQGATTFRWVVTPCRCRNLCGDDFGPSQRGPSLRTVIRDIGLLKSGPQRDGLSDRVRSDSLTFATISGSVSLSVVSTWTVLSDSPLARLRCSFNSSLASPGPKIRKASACPSLG